MSVDPLLGIAMDSSEKDGILRVDVTIPKGSTVQIANPTGLWEITTIVDVEAVMELQRRGLCDIIDGKFAPRWWLILGLLDKRKKRKKAT